MLVSDIERELKALGHQIVTVRQSGSTYTAVAQNEAQQSAVDAALPGVITALQNAVNAKAVAKIESADMIASFTGNGTAIAYFNALQKAIRDVSTNNSIDIATVFPAMKALLDDDAGLYQRYLNLLRIATGISQATFEGTPTAAQQRNAFIVALEFANTGMIQTLFATLHG